MAEAQTPKEGWLTTRQMVASLGISHQAFQKWNVKPVAKIANRNYYTAADVLEARLENERTKRQTMHPNAGASNDYQTARIEHLNAETRLKNIKERQLARELAPVEVLEWALSRIGTQISAILDAIPLNVKRRVPRLTSAEAELIRKEIVKAQNAAADIELDLDEYERDHPTGSTEGSE